MTAWVARWWHPTRLLLSGSGVLFLAVCTWVVISAARLESAPPAGALVAAQRATASPVYKAVYNGWKWWHVYCFRCHGTDALATTLAPSLIDPAQKDDSGGVSQDRPQRGSRQGHAGLGQAPERRASR